MRRWVYSSGVGWFASLGLLVLRLVMGAAFLFHGWPKIQDPTAWMGAGAGVPGWLQALAALAEFAGGAALIVGLLTRLGALGIAAVMVVAVGMVHVPKGDPFVAAGGASYELAAVYLACAILFLLMGAGKYSLDALLFHPRRVVQVTRPL